MVTCTTKALSFEIFDKIPYYGGKAVTEFTVFPTKRNGSVFISPTPVSDFWQNQTG